MSVTEFRTRYFEALLNLLWRQWSRLGITGQIAEGNSPHVCDPEALLIFSSRMVRYDQRLYDLIVEWLCLYGRFISIPRLKALLKIMGQGDFSSLSLMLSYAGKESKDQRFLKLAQRFQKKETASPEGFFIQADGSRNDFIRQKDETALAHGYLRNPYLRPKKVGLLPKNSSALFLLHLRGAFGLSARAETLLILLCRNGATIQEIARRSGFAWKSIQDALGDLRSSNLISAMKSAKRGESYYIREPEKMLALFQRTGVSFPNWCAVYDSLAALWQITANPQWEKFSRQTFDNAIRRCFHTEIGDRFLSADLPELQLLTPEKTEELPSLLEAL